MTEPQQLGFGFDQMLHEQETAYLPATLEEAVPFYQKLIERHHQAMLAGDKGTTMKIRNEAYELAAKLNGGDPGILAAPDGPGYVLAKETAVPAGTVPLWGQQGDYTIDVGGMNVRIEQDGMFGTGGHFLYWPGFSAHAGDYDKPFLSETGYRSFIGFHADIIPGMTPDAVARKLIQTYIASDCKGRPKRIDQNYADREATRRAEKANGAKESAP